ncbi:MAG: LysR family transcriptional regulator [Longibaculum muris]|uniref:DNA-binding transcriptional LysR family regulator n=1 Tax=Longibaculum muris TaxID=1796628 RepID=A0A4R3Z5B5_9FIRM|nr:LysR family transcriptional regulator [Longibaculum muris]KXU46342.1 LysR substrate binding domain protein [Candidatus Stoquefichus sp. KLE1796]MBS5369879.1 LysR family transcriptional regulator [Coprobacillus cateniformis]MCR1889246.1 LysR family transcriptional regulator [Longibaculum muris]MED9810900.1 LysR family transcriptional regulator [Longibaculum muris]TCV99641.1 DNA-binding transcriptional LysR family regulator [Longibaculum muris]
MDIKQMIYFKTIVEAGTISKAAQVLHMAQPPLSMQLKQLEDELGVQLLKRGHRKIELTKAGRLFYKRSLQIISLSEITLHEMKETQNETLRIGITSSNSALIKKTQDFFNQYPTLSFRIYEGTTYEMIDLLLSHNIDLGIVRTPFDQSQVNAYSLEPEPMVAVGTKEYLTPDMTSIENYKDIPLIIHQRYLPLISDYCLNLRFNPSVKMISDDCRTSLIWASSGLGVAIVPTSALLLIQNTSLIQVPLQDEGLLTSVTFITRKDEAILLKVKQFIQSFCQKML